jgi:hypothetical protein
MDFGFHSHVADDVLEVYALGTLPEHECAPVEEHLLLCTVCQIRLEETDEYIQVVKTAAALQPLAPESSLCERAAAAQVGSVATIR